MPSGAPVGFFVDSATEDGGTIGMGAPGQVYRYAQFSARRPRYVNIADARAERVISGVLLISVSAAESRRFQDCWDAMRVVPGSFTMTGWNCASHAALAFAHAGLMATEIPWLDTPDNLFHELMSRHPTRCRDEYGYLGFMPRQSAADEMRLICDVGLDVFHAAGRGPAPPSAMHNNRLPGM